MQVQFTDYQATMAESWLRCRALAYLHSGFTDEIDATRPAFAGVAHKCRVALVGTDVVGFADTWLQQDARWNRQFGFTVDQPIAVLDGLGVHPDYWRRGIAHRLITDTQAWMRGRSSVLFIYTLDDGPANAFYQHLGARLWSTAVIARGVSSLNRVPQWYRTERTANRELQLYDAHDRPIPYALNEPQQDYYVGQRVDLDQLQSVSNVVTEHIYLMTS